MLHAVWSLTLLAALSPGKLNDPPSTEFAAASVGEAFLPQGGAASRPQGPAVDSPNAKTTASSIPDRIPDAALVLRPGTSGGDLLTTGTQPPGGNPAPEPAAFLLVGTGLLGLALSRRWRRQKSS